MIIAKFHPHLGGLERQAFELSRELVNRGIGVYVLTRRYLKLNHFENIEGIKVIRTLLLGKSRLSHSLCFVIFSLIWLITNRKKYQIIHSHQSYSPATLGVLAKLILKKPVLVKISASNELGERRELENLPFKKIRKRLFKKVDHFVSVNKKAIEEFSDLGINKNNFLHIHNGVSILMQSSYEEKTKNFYRNKLNLNFDKIVIFCGRLSEEKGLDVLLPVWARINQIVTDAHLIILGEEGAERGIKKQIEGLREALSIKDSVHLLGRVDNVNGYLLASDVFVLPSISEGMSNSLLEAMASGLAIVASRIDANMAIIKNGFNGLLVERNNPEELTEAILKLLKDEELRQKMGKLAKQTAQKEYSIGHVADRYIQLYRKLLKTRE